MIEQTIKAYVVLSVPDLRHMLKRAVAHQKANGKHKNHCVVIRGIDVELGSFNSSQGEAQISSYDLSHKPYDS
jgi:hypothetical protein